MGNILARGAAIADLSSRPVSPVRLTSPSLNRRRLINEMYNVMWCLA